MPAKNPRLSIVFPLAQVAITAVLTFWADRYEWLLADSNRVPGPYVHWHMFALQVRRVWHGVNAPTFPLCFAGLTGWQLFGFSFGEIFYLVAVGILWYRVGRFFDRRRNPLAFVDHTGVTQSWRQTVFSMLRIIWGLFLLSVSLDALLTLPRYNFFINPIYLSGRIAWLLMVLWSVILVAFPVVAFVSRLRRNSSSASQAE